MINHINIPNEDQQIYCCLRNRVVQLDEEHHSNFCSGCKMLNWSALGQGVECVWSDHRPVGNPHIAKNPYDEWISNQTRKVHAPVPQPEGFTELPEYPSLGLPL